ncbi:MAG: leucine-rich repeat protein [Lachnospira eligens]
MKKRITAALLTAILVISCFPSAGMSTVTKADEPKTENSILTKISEDAELNYNPQTGKYEGMARLQVTGIQDEQCIVLNVNDIKDTNGCTLDITFINNEDKEEMTYKNGDVITIKYAASDYEYNVAYNIHLEVKGTVKKDYRAGEIPELSSSEWKYEISGDTVILSKYIGNNADIVIYPQYSITGAVYNTRMKITQYSTAYSGDMDDYDSNNDYSEINGADGPFVNNTRIKSIKFLDGVKIGDETSKDTVVCADTLNDYSNIYGSIQSIADSTVYKALDEQGSLDMYGNTTVETIEGQNMKAMFAGCTSLEKVENIPDDVVKMENTFRDCKNLVSITNLPSKLKDMGKTFQGCKSLVDIPQIPDGVINMNSAFRNDIKLNPSKRLVIPKTCKNLMETFEKCNAMELCPVIYPETELYNLYYTFYNCYAMTELPAVPDTVIAGVRMFMGCRSAEKVYEDNPINIRNINDLKGAGINNYSISEGLIDAFRGLKKINAEIYLPQMDSIDNQPGLAYDNWGSYGKNISYELTVTSSSDEARRYYVNNSGITSLSVSGKTVLNDMILTDENAHQQLMDKMSMLKQMPTVFLTNGTDFNSLNLVKEITEDIKEVYKDAGYAVTVKCENRGAKADGYKIRTTESKALFWETAIPEDNGGAGNSELKVYLPDNSLYDDISRLASAAGTTGSYTSNILTDKYTEYPAVEVSYSPEHTGDDELTALVNLSVNYFPAKYTVTFYDYDKSTVLYTEEVIKGENITMPDSPTRNNTVTDTSVTSYVFFEWRDCITDSPAEFDSIDKDMDVYAVYTEIVTYTTKLKLEYYTVADLEKEEYDANPYETLVTDYNDVIKTSSYIPGNIVIFTTTEDGFVNTQVWSFDKWESDLEYQLTGIFTGTENVTVKLFAKYKLASESYISTEELDRIYIAKQPDKTSYIVNECFDKTGLVVDAVYKQTWNDGHVTYRTEYNTTYDVDTSTELTLMDTKVIVSKTDKGITKTTDVAITVADEIVNTELDSISIANHADKLSYIKGESFDKTGLVVDAVYKNTYRSGNITYTVKPNVAYSVDTAKSLIPDDVSMDIIFTDNGITKHTEENITVKDIFCVNYYSYDRKKLIKTDMVVEGEDSAAPVAPERADFVTDTSRTAYTFLEWRDTVTDTKALLSGVTSDMNVYAAYTESVTHTTRLTLEYYTVSDLEKGEYDTVPYATVVTDYNAEIKTSSYIPEDKIIHITTADGERIQTWSFDKWESDLEYQLTGRFTGTDNVMVKLYAKYKLVNESYISTEPEEVTEPEKPEETVKTGDNMPVQIYVLLMFVSGALALTVSSVSKSKRQNRQDF